MNIPQIWCEDLVRIYSTDGIEVQALQGLNLSIDEGDVVALVGASGSGKSTLLGILSGNDRPTGGRARVAGVELTTMNRAQRVDYQRHVAGFVRQRTSNNLLPYLSAAENVALPMVIAGHRERDGRDAPTGVPRSCPAGSSNGSPSPRRWPTTPGCCSPTNRPGNWTRRTPRRSSRRCAGPRRTSAPRC